MAGEANRVTVVNASSRAPRIAAIDVTRGALMLAIATSHAMINLEPGHTRLAVCVHYILSGTVGFTTVSGLLVGWFAVVKRDRYDKVARRYQIQAVRLLLVAHPVIALALFLPYGDPLLEYATRTLFITDTLAVFFLLIVPIVPHTAARARLAVGVALIVLDAFLDVWTPPGPATRLVWEILCGVDPSRPHVLLGSYGLLPLGGMFLVGTWIGGRFARAQEAGEEVAFASRLAPIAALLSLLGALLILAWRCAHWLHQPDLARLLFPDYETTLYPIYLGWTLLLVAHAVRLGPDHRVARVLALIGKTSLFVYAFQYYVVQTVPYLLGWNHALSPPAFTAFYVASIGLLIAAAAAWNHWVKRA